MSVCVNEMSMTKLRYKDQDFPFKMNEHSKNYALGFKNRFADIWDMSTRHRHRHIFHKIFLLEDNIYDKIFKKGPWQFQHLYLYL